MAFTTLLITVSLIVIASAGYQGWPDEDSAFPRYPPLMTLRFAGPVPSPQPQLKYPIIPPIPFFRFPAFGSIPLQFPQLPSVQDIATGIQTSNGGNYNGVVFTSQTESKTDENGNLIKKGGSTFVINQDGKLIIHKTGDSPPEILTTSQLDQHNSTQSIDHDSPKTKRFKPLHKFKPFEPFKPFKPFKPFEDFGDFGGFDDFTFPTFKPIKPIKPITADTIRNAKPVENGEYHGHSISSSSFSSNINGVTKQGGIISHLENDNGKVKEQNIVFHNP